MPQSIRGSATIWIVVAEVAVIYILSTLPMPIYVVYREEFHFSEIVLTMIYAAYVIGTVAAMFFLGRLSDQIGRRPVVLSSLGIAAASGFRLSLRERYELVSSSTKNVREETRLPSFGYRERSHTQI